MTAHYPVWLPAILQACSFLIMGTPVAIIAWMVLRRQRDRQAALRPGALRLLWWCVVTIGGLFLLMFASGGHKASPEVELAAIVWIVALTGTCIRWLWTLYRTIGLPGR